MGESGKRQHLDHVSTLAQANSVTRMDLSNFSPNRDLREYLEHIMKSTNMSCLTAEAALSGDCDFLSANMYARSLFGECLSFPVLISRPIGLNICLIISLSYR